VRAQCHTLQVRGIEDVGVDASTKRQDDFEERISRKTHDNETKGENLHLGMDPGPLRRMV
jgi:hypothetical protein